MKLSHAAAALACAGALWLTPAQAQTSLRMSNWLPPSHPVVADMIVPWIADVERATEGRVTVELLEAPLGPPPAQFDIVADGIADLGYGVHNYTPGRFTATQLAELPFLSDTASALSVAYWRVFDATLRAADEHRGTHVLAVFTHGPGQVWNSQRPFDDADALNGLKLRVSGGTASEVAEALGVVAVQAPVTQAYELLAGGVADGILFPSESIGFFNIDEVVEHGTLVPGGLYNVSFFLVINQDTWDGLSAEDQAAIASVSGEAFAKRAGAAWDAADRRGLDAAKEAGVQVETASDELTAALEDKLAPVREATLQRIAETGIDAQAAHEMLQQEIAAAGE